MEREASPHYGPVRCASEKSDFDARLLQCLHDADMGESARPTARQHEADTVARYDPRQPAHVARKFRSDVEMPQDASVFQPLRGAGRAFGLEAMQKDECPPRDRDRRLAAEVAAFHAGRAGARAATPDPYVFFAVLRQELRPAG